MSITIPLEIGDTILVGKFKNKKIVVKEFGKDKNNQPTVNGKSLLNFRISKLMKKVEGEFVMKRSKLNEIQGVLVTANRSDLAKELVVGESPNKKLLKKLRTLKKNLMYQQAHTAEKKKEKLTKRIKSLENKIKKDAKQGIRV